MLVEGKQSASKTEKKVFHRKIVKKQSPIFNAVHNLRVRLKERQQDLSRISFVFSTRRMKTC